MCSRRFLPTCVLSVSLCCVVIGCYYLFLQVTVDGGYTEWSVWSNCTKDCGEGIQTRYRLCENPPPGRYGKDCYRFGANQESKPCFLKICPVDGKLSEWTEFSACDKACGGGKQFRTRQCNNPPPVFGGKPCEGETKEEKDCNTHVCPPVNGGFTDWGAYSPCSVTCGKGTMKRTRSCSNPPPSNGGKPCEGSTSETVECEKGACPQQQPAQKAASPQKAAEQAPQNSQQQQQAAQKPAEQAPQNSQQQEQAAQKPAEQAPQNSQKQEEAAQKPEEKKQ